MDKVAALAMQEMIHPIYSNFDPGCAIFYLNILPTGVGDGLTGLQKQRWIDSPQSQQLSSNRKVTFSVIVLSIYICMVFECWWKTRGLARWFQRSWLEIYEV